MQLSFKVSLKIIGIVARKKAIGMILLERKPLDVYIRFSFNFSLEFHINQCTFVKCNISDS